MRGFVFRALPVCLVAFVAGGCLLPMPGGLFSTANSGAKATPTHAYWREVGTILAKKSAARTLKDDVQLIETQTQALRGLSPEGVDPELVAAVEDLIKCEEKVLEVGAMFEFREAELKTNKAMALTFSDANVKASEAKKRLKALRGTLNDRHGGGFASMG
jgi:hypothetical protein